MNKRRVLLIIWPSFVIAGLIEMLVFTAAHPDDMKGFGGMLTEMSATGVYTLAFFSFWLLCALGSAMTLMLSPPAADPPPAGQSL